MTGIYDIHTHFIPSVDDGSASMRETMELLNMDYQDGVRVIYATPHYRKRMFEPEMEEVLQGFRKMKEAAAQIGEDLRIELGCEFHANMDMIETLNQGMRPAMGNSHCVLVEFSNRWDFQGIRERCYALLTGGYIPIIAHIERYDALYGRFDRIGELTEMGAYMQVNAGSIAGTEGFSVKRFCKKLMRMDLLHFVGSDGHNVLERKPCMGKCSKYMEKVMGTEYTRKILIDNPRDIIEEGR